jgi:ribosomal protein L37E
VRGQLDIAVMCPRCGAPLGSRQRTCTSCGLRLPRRVGRGIGWEH